MNVKVSSDPNNPTVNWFNKWLDEAHKNCNANNLTVGDLINKESNPELYEKFKYKLNCHVVGAEIISADSVYGVTEVILKLEDIKDVEK